MNAPLLDINGLKKHYAHKPLFGKAGVVKALDGISFSLHRGETLAVVGESGCGKSTMAKVLLQLEQATAGNVVMAGKDWRQLKISEYRKQIQMVFQDPYASVNPRKKAGQIIAEPKSIATGKSTKELRSEVLSMMEKVGLRPELIDRYPHMFSGGQRQRIGIARALMLHPKVLLCDEPVSALDISIQAQVLNLLMELQDEFQLSLIFITHDLSVVRHIANRVMVMYLGKIVEYGDRVAVLENPKHPYTKALLASTPSIQRQEDKVEQLKGELPSPLNPPTGCAFHQRCPIAKEKCKQITPILEDKYGRQVACWEV